MDRKYAMSLLLNNFQSITRNRLLWNGGNAKSGKKILKHLAGNETKMIAS